VRERAPTRRLRGADPLTVEVELPALVQRPLHQLAGGTLADLLALCELEELAPAMKVRLRNYPERVNRALRDLPPGNPIAGILDELEPVEAEHVPATLRTALQGEAERRGGADGSAILELLGMWKDTDPSPFEFGSKRVATRKLAEGRRRKEKLGVRQAGVAEAPKPRKAAPKKSAAAGVDPEQAMWIRQTVHERLSATAGAGLLEPVLLAAVRHRARERFPSLVEPDIRKVLRQMSNQGEIRFSARRWLPVGL